MTLRARLVIVLTLLSGLGLLVAGAITYTALRSFLYERLDQQLRESVPQAVRELVGARFEIPFTPGTDPSLPLAPYAEVRGPSGEVLAREEPFNLAYTPALDVSSPATTIRYFTTGAVESPAYGFRVLEAPIGAGRTMFVAIPLEDLNVTLRRLIAIEMLVAVAVLCALALGARMLVRRELRPLDRMGEAATEIAGGDLARRVEPADDRTEVGRLGLALNAMLEQIEAAFEARRRSEERMRSFLADASHELRTPLTSIRGYSELFRRGADERPEDLAIVMKRIEDEAARMGVLVDDLLLLARLDRMRSPEFAPIDLTAVVNDVARDARVRAPKRPIEVSVPARDVVVEADGDDIRRAIANLVTNALVHTPEGTRVEIALTDAEREATVTVADEGHGIDRGAVDHIFDRFWRGDPGRTRATGGAGLGLAIVAAIARAHGGRVSAVNRAGGGALFTLAIPRSRADSQLDPRSA